MVVFECLRCGCIYEIGPSTLEYFDEYPCHYCGSHNYKGFRGEEKIPTKMIDKEGNWINGFSFKDLPLYKELNKSGYENHVCAFYPTGIEELHSMPIFEYDKLLEEQVFCHKWMCECGKVKWVSIKC